MRTSFCESTVYTLSSSLELTVKNPPDKPDNLNNEGDGDGFGTANANETTMETETAAAMSTKKTATPMMLLKLLPVTNMKKMTLTTPLYPTKP